MDIEKIFKSLSNTLRLQILTWLKDPQKNFPPMEHLPKEYQNRGYICVSVIQEKSGITQSTISHYLNTMKQADLLISKRIGQWTYYKRNEETIKEVAMYINNEL